MSLSPPAAHGVPAMSGSLCPTSSCFQSHELEQSCFVSSHTGGQGFYTILLCPGMCCHHHSGAGEFMASPRWGHTECFFSPSSSSLPLGAHGSSDKAVPWQPGWLGEPREGEVTTSPTAPTSLDATPGQGCALGQGFPTMSSRQGGITSFKPALGAPQFHHKPVAEPGALGEPLQSISCWVQLGEITARESPMEGHL